MSIYSAITNYATQTFKDVSFYADGTSGADTNDGLTVATPKKTLGAVFALCPYVVRHTVTFNLVGIFDFALEASTYVVLDKHISMNGNIVLDGGANYTSYAGPFVATANDKLLMTVAAAGWVADAYAGYMIRMDSGAQSGALRTIIKNDATTMNLGRAFTAAPGNETFSVVRPTTTFTHATSAGLAILCNSGPGFYASGSSVWIQRLNLSNVYITAQSNTSINFSASLMTRSAGTTTFCIYGYPSSEGEILCSTTGKSLPSETKCGLGVINTVTTYSFILLGKRMTFNSSYAKGTVILEGIDCQSSFWDYGWRVQGQIQLRNVREFKTTIMFGRGNLFNSRYTNDAGDYGKSLIDNAANGIDAISSDFTVTGGVNISNCSANGIKCNHSFCKLDGNVTTSGLITDAGVYAFNNSVINTKSGTTPTLTGVGIGDLTVDGTTLASTWAAIEGGAPVSDLVELTMAKKI
jgi:hypothetical protein